MKDNLLKYVDLQRDFRGMATEIEIKIRQNQSAIERLAPSLRSFKGKDHQEIERNERLKDFVVKVAQTNESVLTALNSFRDTFQEILNDLELVDAAKLNNTLIYQSNLILEMMGDRDNHVKVLADEVRRRIKGVTE